MVVGCGFSSQRNFCKSKRLWQFDPHPQGVRGRNADISIAKKELKWNLKLL